MTPNDTTKQKTRYSHLNDEEREYIMYRLAQGASIRTIAKELGRSPSTISREIKRNFDFREKKYRYLVARRKNRDRQKKAHQRQRLKDPIIRAYVIELLENNWSPEIIAGRLKREFGKTVVSHETIYQFIYHDMKPLIEHLTRKRNKRRKRGKQYTKKSRIPNRVSIEMRPKEDNDRTETGHWEADTIVSIKGDKGALCVLVERKHRLVFIRKLECKTAEEMDNAVINSLDVIDECFRKSITYDNGVENTWHEKINEHLGTVSYFCHPYHSWEKGSVENINGLIRRFFPKKTKISEIDEKDIEFVEYWLNNRPRKCLDFMTPWESFWASVALAG